MNSILQWLGVRKKAELPPLVPTDTIFPVHYWDNSPSLRLISLHCQFRFDDLLDTNRLKDALEKLLRRDGWRKLGGRLRQNHGKLELHVPAEFDDVRPAFNFYHSAHGTSINEHPIAAKLPKASSAPEIVGQMSDFVPLMRQLDDPTSLDDFLHSDKPALGLHIVSFTDATLVTLMWSHVLFDAIGCKELLDAWSLVLQRREDEVLPFHGIQNDPLDSFGVKSTVAYRHADKQLSTRQLILFGLRYLADQIFWRPREDNRIICVPAGFVQSLRRQALEELHSSTDSARPDEKAFVSEGDVISAWMTRVIVLASSTPGSRLIALNIIFGLRWLLSKDLLPEGTAYVANAASTISVFLTAKELLALPLGRVALSIRKALAELGTREQVEARVATERASINQTGNPALHGDAWMQLVFCTNWMKARFFDVDFSAAVVKSGTHLAGQLPGRPSGVFAHVNMKNFSLVSNFSIVGKDAAGNIWLEMVTRESYWANIDRIFKTSAKDVNKANGKD